MANRKIIFKARVGSHLHGTATPESDQDYLGVFIPSTEDLLGMQNRPSEWSSNEKVSEGPRNTKDDTDCKFLALHEFFKQAADGQSQALELLFIPDEHIIIKTEEWDRILANKDLFISQNSILPFIGFARAQANKAVLKGENLNNIEHLIMYLGLKIDEGLGQKPIVELFQWPGDFHDDPDVSAFISRVPVKIHTNDAGFKVFRVAGRDYDIHLSIKRFKNSLEKLEEKYGSRVRNAAKHIYDFKSVTHAFRLLGEATELLETGAITFPRPDAKWLLEVKLGNYTGDLDKDIDKGLDHIRQVIMPKSSLPKNPKRGKINELCIIMYSNYLIDENGWL